MSKKYLINVLFILAGLLMLGGLINTIVWKGEPINIFYALGLLAYAFGEIIKSQEQKKQERDPKD